MRHGVLVAAMVGVVGFPRPSGRGSIAAFPSAAPHRSRARPSPGHQAGAPLRPGSACQLGLSSLFLPPAIRPGLHCGHPSPPVAGNLMNTSPGHQAGAPLRRLLPERLQLGTSRLPPAIRPGLHCGKWKLAGEIGPIRSFPRPSGRGSIAAPGRPPGPLRPWPLLPPAIRPGLHCGQCHALMRP